MVRHEVCQAIVPVGGDASQDVAKVGQWLDIVTAAGGDQAEEDSGCAAAVVAAGEQPVLAAYRDRADGVFGGVVVDVQIAIGDVDRKGGPLVQRVRDGLAHCKRRSNSVALGGAIV